MLHMKILEDRQATDLPKRDQNHSRAVAKGEVGRRRRRNTRISRSERALLRIIDEGGGVNRICGVCVCFLKIGSLKKRERAFPALSMKGYRPLPWAKQPCRKG